LLPSESELRQTTNDKLAAAKRTGEERVRNLNKNLKQWWVPTPKPTFYYYYYSIPNFQLRLGRSSVSRTRIVSKLWQIGSEYSPTHSITLLRYDNRECSVRSCSRPTPSASTFLVFPFDPCLNSEAFKLKLAAVASIGAWWIPLGLGGFSQKGIACLKPEIMGCEWARTF
jgi:hypothetical protein